MKYITILSKCDVVYCRHCDFYRRKVNSLSYTGFFYHGITVMGSDWPAAMVRAHTHGGQGRRCPRLRGSRCGPELGWLSSPKTATTPRLRTGRESSDVRLLVVTRSLVASPIWSNRSTTVSCLTRHVLMICGRVTEADGFGET